MKKMLAILSSIFLIPMTLSTVISCQILSDQQMVRKYATRIMEANYLRNYWALNYKTIIDINWENPSRVEVEIARNDLALQNFIIANAEWYLFQHLATLIPNYAEYDSDKVIIENFIMDEVWFPPYNLAVNGFSIIPPLKFVFFSWETITYLNKQLAANKPY